MKGGSPPGRRETPLRSQIDSVEGDGAGWYTIHMKRTNLILEEHLLKEATRLSGEKTYSAAVNKALEEYVRRIKARSILELRGSGLWEGDLPSMRSDRPRRAKER
jgi:Arc/MetJ family transcription regulator